MRRQTIKYVVVTLALILLSLIVDRTLFRPSVDEILFNTIQRSLSSEEAPFLAIEVPRYSNRPITADYKTGLILRKDKGRFQVMGVMINLKSVQIKDGVLTLVGDIDLKLLSKKHDVFAVMVRDKFEEDPSELGYLRLIDMESKESFEGNIDRATLKSYKKALHDNDERLYKQFKKQGIRFTKIYTHEETALKLMKSMRR